nr:gastrula zinc finger protein XlCGF28.1-like [Labrus bergylta]
MHLCDVCCKMFQTRGQLNAHLKTHSEEKIVCSVCGKALSSSAHMKHDMRVHSGERPFSATSVDARTSVTVTSASTSSSTRASNLTCVRCREAFFRKEHLNQPHEDPDGEKTVQVHPCVGEASLRATP